jgi:N-methylhydantoinase A
MSFFVGTDVGGTFTDLWVADGGGQPRVFKTPTTADVMTGVVDAVKIAAEAYALDLGAFCTRIKRFGHGTTVSLNALLTGRAARTAIVTTQGFGDTLEIGRMRRQTSGLSETEVTGYFLHNRHLPIVPREFIVEVIERIDANGNRHLAVARHPRKGYHPVRRYRARSCRFCPRACGHGRDRVRSSQEGTRR